ncbi:MAG: relaxase/mobilization nuclease domain-containing protein [Bacilli bacterium]
MKKTKMSDLEQAVLYAANDEKTIDEKVNIFAVTCVNCRAEAAITEMQSVQNRYGKTTSNIAYHAYQSFKTGEISAELCHKDCHSTCRKNVGR